MNELANEANIENMIYEIRGKKVMMDGDVALLFGYETKYLNRQVQRNIKRFPEQYCFQLTDEEFQNLRCQKVTSSCENNYGGRRYNPYVFTEYGITMLSGILKSDIAVEMSLKIVNTFIAMRKYISSNLIEQRYIHNQVIKNTEDIKLLQESFSKFEEKKLVNEIYFNGQIYDAYSKIVDILKEAKNEIIIIDAYADKITLDVVRNLKAQVTLIINERSKLTKLDIQKYNEQYSNLKIIYDNNYHDRYFILDKEIVYHCGTSINNAGSKTFSINKLEDKIIIKNLINNLDI